MRTVMIWMSALLVAVGLGACGSNSSSSSTAGSTAASGAPTASSSSAAAGGGAAANAVVSVKRAKIGMILAGRKELTLYLFLRDKPGSSACSGPCAQVWPPVLSSGKPSAAAGVNAALLGTLQRPDGATQVTYKGHPLYTYAKDGDKGDAYGEGLKQFGGEWYAIGPAGSKVEPAGH